MKSNLENKKYQVDFVSDYAMSNEFEDRAETFAFMVCEGRDFIKRTEKSLVLKKKMEFIIDLTNKRKLLGRSYWNERLNIDSGTYTKSESRK
jgi:hypothetical protein